LIRNFAGVTRWDGGASGMSLRAWQNRLHVTEFAALEAMHFKLANAAELHPDISLRISSGGLDSLR
jgi:hypothetical protein